MGEGWCLFGQPYVLAHMLPTFPPWAFSNAVQAGVFTRTQPHVLGRPECEQPCLHRRVGDFTHPVPAFTRHPSTQEGKAPSEATTTLIPPWCNRARFSPHHPLAPSAVW